MNPAEVESKLRNWLTVQHGPVCPTFTVNGLVKEAAVALAAQAVELERMSGVVKRLEWWAADFDEMAELAEKRRDRLSTIELKLKAAAYRRAAALVKAG